MYNSVFNHFKYINISKIVNIKTILLMLGKKEFGFYLWHFALIAINPGY